jgi:Nickel-dependent hydrogenase/Polysulphide reductase, NrfD
MTPTPANPDERGTTLINHWQAGVPVTIGPVLTPFLAFLMALAAIGFVMAAIRVVSPLGPFSAMNSVYAWGIWKTFNVMTLTALGSGPLALGMAAWVFNRQKLHVVMRTALVSGFLFYATGLIALGFDVGRPWNFYSAVMPWRWNTSSAMLEISICMPLYCAVFLSFEILPLFLERIYYTVEDALSLEIPPNAQYIRNLILIGHALHDHIVHFYHLSALDFVDILQIPKADPAKAASIAEGSSSWTGNSQQELAAVQTKVKGLVASGQLGIFSHGYWGHPAMKLSPEVNLILFSHYLQALDFQRKSCQVVAILGGKTPHIQNLAVGGVMNAINLNSLATMNMDRLGMLQAILEDLIPFVQQVFLPDTCLLAAYYPEYLHLGRGVANYLAVPDQKLCADYDIPSTTHEWALADGYRCWRPALSVVASME